jgi:hypothetical protein
LRLVEIFDGANEACGIIGSFFGVITSPDSVSSLANSGVNFDRICAFLVGGLIWTKRDEVGEEIIEHFTQFEARIITDISLDFQRVILFDGSEEVIVGVSSRTDSDVNEVTGHQDFSGRLCQNIGLHAKRGRAFDLIFKLRVQPNGDFGVPGIDDKS